MVSGKYKSVAISDIFDFPETNSKITKKFCIKHKGDIPVYASSKDKESTLGFIKDGIKGVKYYDDCLSWNRNGSVGYVFLRDHKFATNEDHRALTIKDARKKTLDKLYLKYEIERQLLLNGFSYLDKCGVEKIKAVKIIIPIDKNDNYDLKQQQRLADTYTRIDEIGLDISSRFNTINNIGVDVTSESTTELLSLDDIFEVSKGSAKYTKKYIHDKPGAYPVYSSQTTNDGEIGRIDTYDYDKECFTWTTDGAYAGTVFHRNGRFSVTTHCGILVLKQKYKAKLDYKFLKHKLNLLLPENTLGEWANKRLGVERIKELFVEIPVNTDDELDLAEQQRIASKYEALQDMRESLRTSFKALSRLKVTVLQEDLALIN